MHADDDDRRVAREWLDRAEAVEYEGDPLGPHDLQVADVTEAELALVLYERAARQQRAAAAVAKVLGTVLARALGDGGAARYGNTIVRYKNKASEHVVDEGGFWQAVKRMEDEGLLRVADLFNANDARRTPMPEALRDTFFDWKPAAAPSLSSTPVDKAPLYLQELDEGSVLLGTPVKEADDDDD